MLFREAKHKIYRFIRRRAFLSEVSDTLRTAKAIVEAIGEECLIPKDSTVTLTIEEDEWFSSKWYITIEEIGGWGLGYSFTLWFEYESLKGQGRGVSFVALAGLDRTFGTESPVAFITLASERQIFEYNHDYLGNGYAKVVFVDQKAAN